MKDMPETLLGAGTKGTQQGMYGMFQMPDTGLEI